MQADRERCMSFAGIFDDSDEEVEPIETQMNEWQTFFAIVKGYLESNLLFVPRAFVNGGYVFANVLLVVTSTLVIIAGTKLIETAQRH